jgi:hypothetical protein
MLPRRVASFRGGAAAGLLANTILSISIGAETRARRMVEASAQC